MLLESVTTVKHLDFVSPATIGRLDAIEGYDCQPSVYFAQPEQIADYCAAWLEAQAEPVSADVVEDVEFITYNAYGDMVVGI